MLWIALYLPNLAHEASPSQPEPSYAREALAALAAWAGRYTPSVSLEHQYGLLLEVESSLRLFSGLPGVIGAMRRDLAMMRYTAHIACAPTARAAWWLARAHTGCRLDDAAGLQAVLTELPVMVLDCEASTLAMLDAIGARTLGDLFRLPRGGLAHRFGRQLLDELDRALGRVPEPRRFFAPPARFSARLELAAEATEIAALVFAAERLFVQLEGFLAAQAAGVNRYTLTLRHREQRVTELTIGLVAPSRDAGHFMSLLRERLGRLVLAEPVRAITLAADEVVPLADDNLTLFDDAVSAARHWPKLVEQLRARLGTENAHGLALRSEHRPECTSLACELGILSPSAAFGIRPMWLLPEPQPLVEKGGVPQCDGPLRLVAGPERIESGWWDDASVARDYFIAQTGERALLWIFRRRSLVAPTAGWYLHGIFS